jgi:hypothetical protein
MRRCLSLLLVLAAGTVRAADSPKPNTLTPEEIAEGWISLFDGETTFGWKFEGQCDVKEGSLVLGGDKNAFATATTAFQDFTVAFEFESTGRSQGTPEFRANNSNVAENVGRGKRHKVYPYTLFLNADERWNVAHYEVNGPNHKGGASGSFGGVGTENQGSEILPYAVAFDVPAGRKLSIRSVKLKPLHLNSIVNGKDLTGWKRFTANERQAKSQFTVTPEGWINLKNGPGDLQTEKQWADFVFQGECISNGKALNSGVFFRCLPDKYQQGYEYQIHNGFTDNDRAKPKDYGTGAIYNRVKARKVVPNDHEWFTMTLIANGNHISTWVNGYQTVDWTDTRPENDNARNGCKLGAGPISLQGHDPTTDLSFRNLRIAELKK